MKVAVVFQGGGALGAFGAGAWHGVRDWLSAGHHQLVGLAGGSIGALNAALVAAAPGHPGDVLEACWREAIVTPSFPFLGWPLGRSDLAQSLRSWNGLITGLVLGNRGLYAPQPQHWGPLAGTLRTALPPYDPWPMRALLERRGVRVRTDPSQPLLALAVTEVATGNLRLLHSDEREIVPDHVLASAAIPGLFKPREIDGQACWDGDLVRTSPIPPLVEALTGSGRVGPHEHLCIVTIEQYTQPPPRPPMSGREIAFRAINQLQQGKLGEPLALPARVHRLRLCRPPLANDDISGEFDYSVTRVEALIAQGRDIAWAALPTSGTPAELPAPAPAPAPARRARARARA